MTMTTQSAPKPATVGNIATAPVKDVQAGIKAQASVRLMTEQEILMDASIEAKPFFLPSNLDIKIKNYDNVYRWVNRKSSDGYLHSRARGIGFVNATPDDVELVNPDCATITDNSFVIQDCVLMKLPRMRYYEAIKANMLKAQNAVVKGKNDAKTAAAPAEQAGVVSIFQPDKTKVDSLISSAQQKEADALAKASGN